MKTAIKKKSVESVENLESTPAFEDALAELEKIIEALELDNVTLNDALSNFEQGIRLIRICENHLNAARRRVLELVKGENGEIVERVLGKTLESFLDGEENNG
ncbi:MAG TPA: exodeoxyribonuclease VII small subunit [Chitinispirillaceae bacterium]|nr:exodeoxyribonuclease VII small subunit [Chitinispirillaceae bacterium]